MASRPSSDREIDLEHYTEACRISLEVLGGLISEVEDITIRSRLGVVEDILSGAVTRYTE